MKKVLFFVMLLLTTSVAMAQFGKLEDLGKKQENSSDNNTENPSTPGTPDAPINPGAPGIGIGGSAVKMQIIEEALKDGFFLIRQDYQLEDKKDPGSRFNWGDEPSFGYGISFIVRLNNGFVTTSNIVEPWKNDERFSEYENTHNPVFLKTSTMKVGQKEWKTEGALFQPKMEKDLSNDLLYVKDTIWNGGFTRATGYGKKDVYVVWLMAEGGCLNPTKPLEYYFETTKIETEEAQNSVEVSVPYNPRVKKYVGGIVVEPVCREVGKIELALVGVINLDNKQPEDGKEAPEKWNYRISLLDADMGQSDNTLTPSSSGSLTPSGRKKKNK